MDVAKLELLEEVEERLKKLEKHGFDDALTLVEILSCTTFFGGFKMERCKHADRAQGQCSFFFLPKDAKKRVPIATDCRIKNCVDRSFHCHLDLSNIVCAFCPEYIPRACDYVGRG